MVSSLPGHDSIGPCYHLIGPCYHLIGPCHHLIGPCHHPKWLIIHYDNHLKKTLTGPLAECRRNTISYGDYGISAPVEQGTLNLYFFQKIPRSQ